MLQTVAQHDASIPELTRSFFNTVLSVAATGLFAWAVFSVVHDLHGFLSRETAERLWVGPGLSLALLPYLYIVDRYSAWELARFRRCFRPVRTCQASTSRPR